MYISHHLQEKFKNIRLANTLEDPAMAICPNGVISASWQWLAGQLPQSTSSTLLLPREVLWDNPPLPAPKWQPQKAAISCVEKSELWGLEEVFRKQLGKTPVVQDLLRCTHLPLFQDEDSKAINAIKLLCLNILYVWSCTHKNNHNLYIFAFLKTCQLI